MVKEVFTITISSCSDLNLSNKIVHCPKLKSNIYIFLNVVYIKIESHNGTLWHSPQGTSEPKRTQAIQLNCDVIKKNALNFSTVVSE